ncbi:MAG TPA: lysylphosphatidylglycerol synthase transmembrane domain-containing protein [Anaerolineae bacterium]
MNLVLRQKRFWLGILVSLVLVVLFFGQTDSAGMLKALASAQYIYLLPALVLFFCGVFLRAARWYFLLRTIKPVPLARLFNIVVIGYTANDLLPFRIGELVRAFLMGQQEGLSKTSTLVTIALERVFDGLTMLAFIGLAAFFLPLNDYLNALLRFGAILFVIVLLALGLVATQRERIDPLVHRASKRLPDKYGARLLRLFDSFIHGLSVFHNPLDAVISFLLSVLAWIFEAGMYAVLAAGFGIIQGLKLGAAASFFVFVLATAVANLFTIVPSTPGYVGVFDAPVKYVLTLFAVDPNLATSYTLVLHAALVLPIVILGLFLTARTGLSFGQLTHQAEAESAT